MKRLLIIFLLMSSVTSAADFNVTWTPIKEDIVNKEYMITIQNLNTDMRTVDVKSFFEDTNFDTSKIRNVEFYEQTVKSVKKEIKHYKTIQVPKTVSHIDNKTGMLINTTKMVNKRVLDYVEKKTVNEKVFDKQKSKVLNSNKKIKEVSHGKITLPSVKTKGKINNAGTKTFILKFKTPPTGSYGKVGLKINGKEYHPYWNSTWSNRKKIILTCNTSEPLLDRQLLLNITYESEMNSDFSDVRFCNETDQLSAWLESKVNESYALIWIRFPYLPPNGETKDYWMYYGNSEVDAYWNGSMTFEFFDDFNRANTIPGSNWQVVGNILQDGIENNTLKVEGENSYHDGYASTQTFSTSSGINIRTRCKADGATSYYDHIISGISDYTPFTGSESVSGLYGISLASDNAQNKDKIRSVIDGSFTIYNNGNITQYHTLETKMSPNGTKNYFDGQLIQSSDVGESINVYIYLVSNTGNYGHVDWVFIYKYTFPEPTYAFGDTEYYVDSIYFNSSNPYYNLIDYKGDIAVNHSYYPSDDLEWTAAAKDNDTGLVVTSIGSSEIDFTTYENVLDWLQLVNLDDSKIYTLQNSSGDLEEHQASGNAVNFTTDLSPDDYEIEITAVPTPSPTITPTGVQPANYSGTKLSDADIKSFYYPFMYILFIVIIIGGFMHVFGN